jgi:hypothetical protein
VLAAEPPAAQAPLTPAAREATSTVSATSANAAVSGANADVAKEADAKAQAAALDKRMRSRGYKPKVKNGVTVYCRNEPEIGSHFEHLVCGSGEDLENAALSAQAETERIQQASHAGSAK